MLVRSPGAEEVAMRAKSERDGYERLNPGAYVGRMLERERDCIVGGTSRKDERLAPNSTRSWPVLDASVLEGRLEGSDADDDWVLVVGLHR
jgi:hypothetical protein